MRRLFLVLGAIVALALAGGGAALWWFLSQFDARAEIVQRVKLATGRDFAIRGPVSVSLWPAIGFKGEDVVLANVAGGAAPHLLEAREIILGVALKPLLKHRVEVTRFALTAPVLSLEVDAQGRPNWILRPTAPVTRRTPASPTARVEEVQFEGMSVTDGRISYANARTKTAYALDGVALTSTLKGLDGALDVDGKVNFRQQPVNLELRLGKFRALMTGGSTPLALSVDAPAVKGLLVGDLDVKSGGLAGDITATGPSLRGLAEWSGAPMAPGPGFEAFTVAGRVTAGPRRYAFENATIKIDAVEGRGDFLFEQSGRVPLLSGRLELKALDLNPYLQPRVVAAGSARVASIESVNVAAPGWSETPIDLTGLKTINANLELTTGPLLMHKVTLDRTRLAFVLNDGYLAATLSELAMYGGNGTGRFEIDARTPAVTIRNELAVQAVDARRFFADAFGFSNLEGTAKLDWGFSSTGHNQKEMIQALKGAGSAKFTTGVLHGVDIGGVSRTIRNALRHELTAPGARTSFSNLSANFRAADGVIATQDLRMDMADARITAIGVIDAGGRAIDMRLVPRLGSSGLPVPFRVSGPWTGINYAPDFLGRARPAIEARARAVIARAPRH